MRTDSQRDWRGCRGPRPAADRQADGAHLEQDHQADPAVPVQGYRRHRVLALSIGLFLALTVMLVWGPPKPAIDTKWVIPTAMSFIHGKAGDIVDYTRPEDVGLVVEGQRRYNFWPVGTALLSIPFVAVFDLVDPAFKDRVKSFDTAEVEKIIAAIFGAMAGAVFFWVIYAEFHSVFVAGLSTFVLIFCTSMLSIATRALWSHGPLVLATAVAMLILLTARRCAALVQYASLPLAAGFIIRPSASASIVALSAYVLFTQRRYFIRYLAWAAVIATPWFAFNLWSFGRPFPPYYFQLFEQPHLAALQSLAIQLVSPGRGLFVFSPVLLFAISGFVFALKVRDERALHLAFAAAIILHLSIVMRFPSWSAGWSFGPRYMTDVLPYLVYFISFNLRAILPINDVPKIAAAVAIGVFAVVSLVIHSLGAFRGAPDRWVQFPVEISDDEPSRFWDWRDLSFTRGTFINPEPR